MTKKLFWNADTTTIRLILAVSSLVMGVALLFPAADFHGRAGFSEMGKVGPAWTWGAAFFLHFILLSWRFLDPKPRVMSALVVNSYGLLIWLVMTIDINVGFHSFAPGTSAEWVLCAFAALALFRTGLHDEILKP